MPSDTIPCPRPDFDVSDDPDRTSEIVFDSPPSGTALLREFEIDLASEHLDDECDC